MSAVILLILLALLWLKCGMLRGCINIPNNVLIHFLDRAIAQKALQYFNIPHLNHNIYMPDSVERPNLID